MATTKLCHVPHLALLETLSILSQFQIPVQGSMGNRHIAQHFSFLQLCFVTFNYTVEDTCIKKKCIKKSVLVSP